MTFTLALIIILALATIALSLLAYHLMSRLHLLEEAVAGGMGPPSRALSSHEFARRFAVARARAAFAREVQHGVVVFLDDGPASEEILGALRNLSHPRGFVLAFAAAAPATVPGFRTIEHLGPRLDALGITLAPFGLVIDDAAIVDARPLGSSAALDSLLLEVA